MSTFLPNNNKCHHRKGCIATSVFDFYSVSVQLPSLAYSCLQPTYNAVRQSPFQSKPPLLTFPAWETMPIAKLQLVQLLLSFRYSGISINVPSKLRSCMTQKKNYAMHKISGATQKKINKIDTFIFQFLQFTMFYSCDEGKYDGDTHFFLYFYFLLRNDFQNGYSKVLYCVVLTCAVAES